MKRILISILVLTAFSSFAQKVDSVTKSNTDVEPSSTNKGKDIIVVDGELYSHNLKDLSPADIYTIDILDYKKAADLGWNVNSATIVVTKKGAIVYYQNILALYCELYKDYIKLHTGDDTIIKYLLNDNTADIDALYHLKSGSIDKVTFALGNEKPIVKIITKD